ncbi:MAG: hypothetical protein KDK39_14985 [Leptospiraceae bacterium]|nr:hypothetical protein [Leptospiraceae bacterium]
MSDSKLFRVALLILITAIHVNFVQITSYDSRWSVLNAVSLLRTGDLNLAEYQPILKDNDDYGIVRIGDKAYDRFPIGTSLIVTPAVFVLMQINGRREIEKHRVYVEEFLAAMLMALSGYFFFIIAKHYLEIPGTLFLVALFVFCTPLVSTGSRALWSNSGSIFVISLLLLFLFKSAFDARWLIGAGLTLGLAYVVRPTNALSVLVFSAYAIFRFKEKSFLLFLPGLVIAVSFFAYNFAVYSSILSPYYSERLLFTNTDFWNGFFASLFSPSRGLFIWAPALFFAWISLWIAFRNKDRNLWLYVACAIVFWLHLIAVGSFKWWHGGHSIGPRLMTDVIPLLTVMLIPLFRTLERGRYRVLVAPLLLASMAGLWINWHAANEQGSLNWIRTPENVDSNQNRAWNWHDAQFNRQNHTARLLY